uniref:hypothetical protein n=1 Tax=Paralagenidium karlingii TaxID=1440115 RepID=UPI0026E1EB09|nr:hypothetical protein Q6B14_mgp17 [Paralagenidium karlingii]WJH17932.1 hypothetical protein [Paralagenidium karlingii]
MLSNQIENLKENNLKLQEQLQKQMTIQNVENYDTKKILMWVGGTILIGGAGFFAYSYFFGGDDGTAAVLINYISDNMKNISKHVTKENIALVENQHNINKNLIGLVKSEQIEGQKILLEAIKNSSNSISDQNTILTKQLVEQNNQIAQNVLETLKIIKTNIIDYVFQNVSLKLNNLEKKIEKSLEMAQILSDNLPNEAETKEMPTDSFSGTGHVLGTGEVVENKNIEIKDSLDIKPSDIIFD